MVINKTASKIYKIFVLQILQFYNLFFGIVFVSSSFDLASASASRISLHVITESSIILAKYFPLLPLHVA